MKRELTEKSPMAPLNCHKHKQIDFSVLSGVTYSSSLDVRLAIVSVPAPPLFLEAALRRLLLTSASAFGFLFLLTPYAPETTVFSKDSMISLG